MMSRSEKGKILEEKLKKEEHEEKKHRFIKTFFKVFFIMLSIFVSLLLYMHFIGTKNLEVREYKIESNRLPESFYGFKIVQFSDLHYLTTINKKELGKIVNKINELKPDVVVFTGDLFDEEHKLTEEDYKTLTKKLNKIEATTGLYAIKGNHDYENNNFEKVFNETKFKILNNTYDTIYYKGTTPILLTGINSVIKNDCDYNEAFSFNEIDNLYTITILHEPDIIDSIVAKYHVDLALAGHTHNGQIRIPGIGAVIRVSEGRKYANSYYKINNTKLYVSGGLGTSMYQFRWFNKPSINLYRLTKEAN